MTVQKEKKTKISPGELVNEVRFRLLELIPEFQKDLMKIRVALGVPHSGFDKEGDYRLWYEKKTGYKLDDLGYFVSDANNILIQAGRYLGDRYKLPESFYLRMDPHHGLIPYIGMNIIKVPERNWVIDVEGTFPDMKLISIKTYSPLTRKEMNEVMRELVKSQSEWFPKEIMSTIRSRKKFNRDLEIYKSLASRATKPVLKKQGSTFMKHVWHDPAYSNARKREIERNNPNESWIDYTEKTSRQAGKELHVKSDATRQSLRRIRKLMKQLFGEMAP